MFSSNSCPNENIEDYKNIIEDANKLIFVFPQVPLWDIIISLSKLPKHNRIIKFVQNYFDENQISSDAEKSLDNDVNIIHNILPTYTKENILRDLLLAENEGNRVQHVIKQYINYKNKNKNLKRLPNETVNNFSPEKKVKHETDSSDENNSSCSLSTNNSMEVSDNNIKSSVLPEVEVNSISIIPALKKALPNKTIIDLIIICNKYGYKPHDKIPDREFNDLLRQIISPKIVHNHDEPCTSSYQKYTPIYKPEIISEIACTEEYDLQEDFISFDNIDEKNSPIKHVSVSSHGSVDKETKIDAGSNAENNTIHPIENGELNQEMHNRDSELVDVNQADVVKVDTIDLTTESSNDSLLDAIESVLAYTMSSPAFENSVPLENNQQNAVNIFPAQSHVPLDLRNVKSEPINFSDDLDKIDTKHLMNIDFDGKQDDSTVNAISNPQPQFVDENIAGPSNSKTPMYYSIMQMFPEICPNYLEGLLKVNNQKPTTIEVMINYLLETNYKRRVQPKIETNSKEVLDFDEEMSILEELFPDADPSFLQYNCEKYVKLNDPEQLRLFVERTLESKDYPTKENYLKKLKLSAQEKKYTTEFSVENFLEVIPDPLEYFSKPNKPKSVKLNYEDTNYKLLFFKNQFNTITIKDITSVMKKSATLIDAAAKLDVFTSHMVTKRKIVPLPSCDNIPLLQELAFIKHKSEILEFIKKNNEAKEQERLLVKQNGLLKTCQCCFDDEVMPDDIVSCETGHAFCKSCVAKSVEVEMGQGKLDFRCLEQCDKSFTLKILQLVLKPNVFSKLALKKQLEEIKAAGLEDLVSCPFCDFATIPAPGDKLFRCLNEECMKESCLACKEPSHIPLRCDELEKDQQVKMRTYIEDKMTEALLRKCWKCGLKFIKEGGCNKMTCSCGAKMCYLCNKPVKDYKHFNGQGGDQHHLCPLFSDTVQLHADAVIKGAELAKAELGIQTEALKIDPAKDIENHYKDVKKQAGPYNVLGNPHVLVPNNNINHHNIEENLRRLHNPHRDHNHYHFPLYHHDRLPQLE